MTGDMMIAAEAVGAISTSVIGITQLIKWAGVPTKYAPPILAFLSLGAVLLYIYRPFTYGVIVAATIVMMSASGVYGFATRAGKDAGSPAPEPEISGPDVSPARPAVVVSTQTSVAVPDGPDSAASSEATS